MKKISLELQKDSAKIRGDKRIKVIPSIETKGFLKIFWQKIKNTIKDEKNSKKLIL